MITLTVQDGYGVFASTTATVSVPDKHSIAGTIFNSNGTTPFAGAKVYLQQGGISKAVATTLSDGAYSFANLNPGTYQVLVYKFSESFDGDAAAGVQNPINVTVGPDAAGKNFSRVAFSVTVNTSGLDGVTVYLSQGGVTKASGSTVGGTKVFTEVKPGNYQVSAYMTGYDFDGDTVAAGNQSTVNVTVGPNQTVTFSHTP